MIKKSLTLLTLAAVNVQAYEFNFFEEFQQPKRNLKNTLCTKDSECKSVAFNTKCMKH